MHVAYSSGVMENSTVDHFMVCVLCALSDTQWYNSMYMALVVPTVAFFACIND